jgi:hypothetical protein
MDTALYNWKKSKFLEYKIYRFYYLFRLVNIRSILVRGILSQNEVIARELLSDSFADPDCQDIRDRKEIYLTDGRLHKLHNLVPLYFTPKTPTLFRIREDQETLAFAEVESFVILDPQIEYAFCDGNATSHPTSFSYDLNKLDRIDWKVIRSNYWNDFPDGKRIRNAEFFIYPRIPLNRIARFIVFNAAAQAKAEDLANKCQMGINVIVDTACFF